MSEWQPIETAEHLKKRHDDPEGRWCGESLLLWVKGKFYIGHWDPETFHRRPRPHWDYACHRGKHYVRENQPTHWLLPPPLPSDEEAPRADTGSPQERGQPDTEGEAA